MHDQVARNAAAKQKFRPHNPVRRGYSIPCNHKMASDIDFAEQTASDVEQIQNAGDSCINLGRNVYRSVCHESLEM
jgi:hypothetical protein